ncbi:MAG: response regulator transcription factor [Chloroflexi bacterium]|nr:response regulator transcription factor [Chloroflexota bacterium]
MKGEIEVVGEAATGGEALEKVAQLRPHVVLMDVRLSDANGIDCTRQIKESMPEVAVILLTAYENRAYIAQAVRAGVSGYLLKDVSLELLLETVKAARSGGALFKGSLLRTALGSLSEARSRRGYESSTLVGIPTKREQEVLELLVRGFTNKEIGTQLHITELTVKKHMASIAGKLGARNRSEAAVRAIQEGLVPLN